MAYATLPRPLPGTMARAGMICRKIRNNMNSVELIFKLFIYLLHFSTISTETLTNIVTCLYHTDILTIRFYYIYLRNYLINWLFNVY